jgi:hypothetical protein
LFSPSRFANPRKPAQRLQPLCAICFALWPCGRDEHLSYLRLCSHCSALRHDFKFLPDVKIQWRDVWIGAVMTAILFGVGKWLLGLYLGSGAAGSAYGPASSLITLLLWIYYSSQILLLGAEFTQVYAARAGRGFKPSEYAVRVQRKKSKLVSSRL